MKTDNLHPKNQYELECKYAIFGTNYGTIRCYNWPFNPKEKKNDYFEIKAHQGPVNIIQTTLDHTYIISGGEDGQIQITKIEEF